MRCARGRVGRRISAPAGGPLGSGQLQRRLGIRACHPAGLPFAYYQTSKQPQCITLQRMLTRTWCWWTLMMTQRLPRKGLTQDLWLCFCHAWVSEARVGTWQALICSSWKVHLLALDVHGAQHAQLFRWTPAKEEVLLLGMFWCVLRRGVNKWQGARDAALEREAQLTTEKAQLKSGLGTALEQKALLDTQLATALSEQQALRSQVCYQHGWVTAMQTCSHAKPFSA